MFAIASDIDGSLALMLRWNHDLFLLINASESPAAPIVLIANLFASSPVYVVPALLIFLWVRGRTSARGGLLSVTLGLVAGLGINQILGLLWHEPRPFMIGLGHTLTNHVVENSFPSDHATLIWSLAFGLIATQAASPWGIAVSIVGLLVGWARIYLGVHFPIDIFASVFVALASAAIARLTNPPIAKRILPTIDGSYEGVLRSLSLPIGLFPRR